mgnify:CR=1 FL=1
MYERLFGSKTADPTIAERIRRLEEAGFDPADARSRAVLLGRAIDGFGRPIDGGPAPACLEHRMLRASAPAPLSRRPISTALQTGVRCIDGLTTLAQLSQRGRRRDAAYEFLADYLDHPREAARIAAVRALGAELIAGLNARGWPVITPEAPEERGGNVCFLAEDAGGLAAKLAAERVLVWGGEGRIRVSPHVHDDREDVERFFEALDRAGARPQPSRSFIPS